MSQTHTLSTLAVNPRPLPTGRRRWGALLFGLIALGLLVVIALALLTSTMPIEPVHLSVDGDEVWSSLAVGQMPPAHKVLLAGVILIAMLAALVVLPLALLLGALALGALLLSVVALPLLLAALIVGLVLSPLWLLLWLLWRAVA